jgi:enterochelin esterase family protein
MRTLILALALFPAALLAQQPAPPAQQPPLAPVLSPEVLPDRRVAFRIRAAKATAVRLSASDIPGVGPGQMTKGAQDVWEIVVGPIDPGAYRYNFNVDGVATIDPRNPVVSGSNTNVWSMVYVSGSEAFDTKDVPRGAVAEVTYQSTALGAFRRMHVYTPPGYDAGKGKYPVFYLLHGAGDNDDAWSSVGRAGFILDNLIAAGKAKQMVVVMPAGHTPVSTSAVARNATEAFVNDFVKDVMPYVESHYRVRTDRAHTAIAGLSMGGNQTLQVAIPRLERFAYIGVFSSGLLGAFPAANATSNATPNPNAPSTATEWAKANASTLDNAKLKAGLKLLWFATGKTDGLLSTTTATVELFKQHGFKPVMVESPGGHTWINWRNYLVEFVPQLFSK